MKTIVERGSSHILVQNTILKEEYARFGQEYSIDQRVIEKELREYEMADYISIPSDFVRDSFLLQGIPAEKLIQNAYGVGSMFSVDKATPQDHKFRVLYVGSMMTRKGIIYLCEAIKQLQIPKDAYEIWLIGVVRPEVESILAKYKQSNWKVWGHIPQVELASYINQCSVAIHPSLEEGLSMVIAQLLACGVPVIATTNTGGMNIIREGETGYIVPIRDPQAIAERIEYLYQNPEKLAAMQQAAPLSVQQGFTWNDYGNRYAANIKKILEI